MLMIVPVHCLEGLLVSRVDEQQMHRLTEWVPEALLRQLLCFLARHPPKHTVVMDWSDSAPPGAQVVSLFQPKTATIEDIAIALVKMFIVVAWRTKRDI